MFDLVIEIKAQEFLKQPPQRNPAHRPFIKFLYDHALETIREFDAFRHWLYDYISEQAMP